MKQVELQAEKREIIGRKVNRLRREGKVPAILYGHDIDPIPLQVPTRALDKVLNEAGSYRLINLRIDGGERRVVLAKEVQRHPTSQAIMHADFQEVVMTEQITAEVPIELVGESPAVASGSALMIQGLDQVEVQCLPGDLPAAIVIDLGQLTEPDQALHVKDISMDVEIEVLSDPEEMVIKLLRPKRPQLLVDEERELEEAVEEITEPEVLSAQRRVEREAERGTEEPTLEDEEEA